MPPPRAVTIGSTHPSSQGFSLVELLVVVALLGIVIGIGTKSFSGYGGAARLTGAAVQCANVLEGARDVAILRKNPVAVAIFPPSEEGNHALTVFEYQPESQQWQRISPWERLPDGVVIDPEFSPQTNSARAANSPGLFPALPAMQRAGKSYSPGQADGYAYLVFLPTGALKQAHARPGRLRLVQGFAQGGEIIRSAGALQHLDLVVNPSTGRLKLIYPEAAVP